MARVTNNRQVESIDGNIKREGNTNAPAFESENARYAQVGPFVQINVAAGQSGVALAMDPDTDILTFVPAGRAGTVVGIAWGLSAASTHTAGSLKCTVGGTASGTAVAIDGGGTAGVGDETTPVSFAEGDKLGIKITTDANWLPVTTDLQAWLLIRWAA